ncbi:PREDICTED: DNA repair endonuclease XPF-like, partial [Amphimedon queenslandica]|uniref:Uncharacterized protein n=1 Tax=Amphimedon queenslandica TaxID=400682 RepID=A0AAN0IT62_AMPQE
MASVTLDFENENFLELVSEDGLIILAKGLGLDRLFMKFLKLHSDPRNLVLVIGSSTLYEDHFKNDIAASLSNNIQQIPRSVTNEIPAKEREELYLKGGVLFVTSRILVVDMLRKVCPVDKVAGILVYNCHRVTDSSSEAFILRLYREGNKTGFIKGFSDCPEHFTTGFCQLERIMRNLFPDVIELRQQMTPSMTAIQHSVLEIMKACVRELKETNSLLESDEITIDNCLGKGFEQIIKIQFDPVWNQL